MERIGDTVLKVSMLLSLAASLGLVIDKEHIDESVFRCEECFVGMQHVTMGSGKSLDADPTALILKELLKRPGYKMTRKQVLSKFWGDVDYITLDRIAETLVRSGAITADNAGKEVIYTMTRMAVENYTKFKTEIN